MNKLPVGSGVGVGMSENTLKMYRYPHAYFSYLFHPLTKNDKLFERPDMICFAKPLTLIAYAPTNYKLALRKRIFVLRGGPANIGDLAKTRRYRSYDDFLSCASRNAFLNFIAQCTYISQLTFDIAFENVGTAIPIGINYEKYMELCGGHSLLYDYDKVEAYKKAMYDRFDEAAMKRAKKKIYEGK